MLPEVVCNQLKQDGVVAAEVAPKMAGYRAWVEVIAFAIDRETRLPKVPSEGDRIQYRVMCFDLPSHLDFENYEVDDYCEFRFDVEVATLEEVEEWLSKCLSDTQKLAEPRRCDFPI